MVLSKKGVGVIGSGVGVSGGSGDYPGGIVAAMKERPIIMAGDNPNLIQDGRKTQTRRIVKPQPPLEAGDVEEHDTYDGEWFYWLNGGERSATFECPYGVAGDRLWVRERLERGEESWIYFSDGSTIEMSESDERAPQMFSWVHHQDRGYCPSIHMPRWASRITLEITRVRVERVQDISYKDALAEGMKDEATFSIPNAIANYMGLWDSLHGKGAWERNDWVWVLDFQML